MNAVVAIACVYFSNIGISRADSVTYLGTEAGTGDCLGDCCQVFKWTISAGTGYSNLTIALNENTPLYDCSCLSTTCFNDQTVTCTGGLIPSHVSLSGANPDCLHWTLVAPMGSVDETVTFTICGTNDCWKQFPTFNWYANDGFYKGFDVPLSLCYDGYPACYEGCPWVNATDTRCFTDVPFHNDQTGCLTSIVLNFNPGLSNCNLGNGLTGGGTPNCSATTTITLHSQNGGVWTGSYNSTTKDLTLSLSGPPINCLPICDLLHILIPKCSTTLNQTITVEPITDPCDEWTHIVMKDGAVNVQRVPRSSTQNYPNPLDSRTGFHTTIPFETDNQGIATISITNEAGQKVLNESMEAAYAGQHFFYFSGESLPAGKYFYQIEFPQGVVIVNRTMVIVK